MHLQVVSKKVHKKFRWCATWKLWETASFLAVLAICYGIRLWLVWALVYEVTFAQTYQVHAKAALHKGGAFAPALPPSPPLPESATGLPLQLHQLASHHNTFSTTVD